MHQTEIQMRALLNKQIITEISLKFLILCKIHSIIQLVCLVFLKLHSAPLPRPHQVSPSYSVDRKHNTKYTLNIIYLTLYKVSLDCRLSLARFNVILFVAAVVGMSCVNNCANGTQVSDTRRNIWNAYSTHI